jgi:class 3 adenylate cyclase
MPDHPSGTVTFLFTDIEGSTALWEQDQAAMATAVDRHEATPADRHRVAARTAFPTAREAVSVPAARRAMPPPILSAAEAVTAVGRAAL